MVEVTAKLVANVASVAVGPGTEVAEGDTLLVVESMKMEIPVAAPATGTVLEVRVDVADVIQEGDILVVIEPNGTAA
ncbi:MAG: biotin/lipoyl-binding carrier protein [Egibacteraceae bacterium]